VRRPVYVTGPYNVLANIQVNAPVNDKVNASAKGHRQFRGLR
jgi:hypothetical protein